jgi:hypothetical protein
LGAEAYSILADQFQNKFSINGQTFKNPVYEGASDWVGGQIGEKLLFEIYKKMGKLTGEDVWNAETKSKLDQFTEECKAICRSKKRKK